MQLPKVEEPISITTNTQVKVKLLKEIIKEKAPKDSELSEIAPDRLSLQIEGGDVLKKGSATLEEVGLRENNVILVSISDKSGSASQATRDRKAKEEPKVPIIYTLKQLIEEDSEQKEGDDNQINTSSIPKGL